MKDSIDEVIVVSSMDVAALYRSVERLHAIAKRRRLACPATARLVDSDGRNVAKFVLVKFEARPDAVQGEKMESDYARGELKGDLQMPVFWVLEDLAGNTVKIRIQLDSQSLPA
jgi:hypothetical protein